MATQPAPHAKPMRLALACNQCRKRKVRCDARQPRCRNCELRDDVCESRDPRHPGQASGTRRPAAGHGSGSSELRHLSPPASASQASRLASAASASPSGLSERPPANSRRRVSQLSNQLRNRPSSTSTRLQRRSPQREQSEEHISWLTRAYQQSTAESAGKAHHGEVGEADVEHSNTVSPDVVVNKDGKFKFLGGSSIQFLFTFVDLHLSRHGFGPISPLFKHGMGHSEECAMPIVPLLPELPERHVFISFLDTYFSRLWPFHPILDRTDIEADFDAISADQQSQALDWRTNLKLNRVPTYVAIYAIIGIGMNESPHADIKASRQFIDACYSLHGHLAARPYLSSVQGLILVALALRELGKDGQAWHLTGTAIRMAQSLGLHRLGPRRQATNSSIHIQQESDLRERLWWTCYALEKLLQLECGRPSSIDSEYDHVAVNCNVEMGISHASDYFTAWVSLASIMGQISARLYSHVFSDSGEMLAEVARLDQSLVEWESSLPHQLKPRNAFPEHGNDAQILNVFLSQQFHHAQIATLRVALIFPQRSYHFEIDKRSAEVPDSARLLSGPAICIHAARSMVTNVLQLADAGVRSVLLSGPQLFLATAVLALTVLRQPNSRLARSDVELLKTVTEYEESWWREYGMTASFTEIFALLRERVAAAFQNYANGVLNKSATPRTNIPRASKNNSGTDEILPAFAIAETDWMPSGPGRGEFEIMGQGDSFFDSIELDNLWTMMDSDFLLEC